MSDITTMAQNITYTHGFKHMQGNPEYREEEKNCHLCQGRNFDVSKAGFTMAITNDVDDEWIDPNFRFIEKCEYGENRGNFQKAPEDFESGCECKSDLACAVEGCFCLADLDEENIINPQYRNAYYTAGPRKGLLREELLETSSDEIYECSDLCSCTKDCPNRVVGRGREFNIEIFRTEDGRGWGVRAREDIRKGQFIDKYVGEILTPAEANRRRQAAKSKGQKDLYLFGLDKFNDPESGDPRLQGEPYEVDGEFIAGPTRFINHSCEPNLRIMAVVTDRANKHLHELCFFALEDIPRLTEFTFDYIAGTSTQEDSIDVVEEAKDRQHKGMFMTKCLCGTKSCRGWLW